MEDNKKSPGDCADASKYMVASSPRQAGKSAVLGMDYAMKEMLFDQKLLDKMRKLTEGYAMAEENRPKVDKLKTKRKELQTYLNKIDKCIEQAEKLQFKDGDVIYSKEHGPVVVTDVIVDIDEPAYQADPFAREPFKFFYKGYAQGGQVSVKAEEALPYNETTKLLYEKNKSR